MLLPIFACSDFMETLLCVLTLWTMNIPNDFIYQSTLNYYKRPDATRWLQTICVIKFMCKGKVNNFSCIEI